MVGQVQAQVRAKGFLHRSPRAVPTTSEESKGPRLAATESCVSTGRGGNSGGLLSIRGPDSGSLQCPPLLTDYSTTPPTYKWVKPSHKQTGDGGALNGLYISKSPAAK